MQTDMQKLAVPVARICKVGGSSFKFNSGIAPGYQLFDQSSPQLTSLHQKWDAAQGSKWVSQKVGLYWFWCNNGTCDYLWMLLNTRKGFEWIDCYDDERKAERGFSRNSRYMVPSKQDLFLADWAELIQQFVSETQARRKQLGIGPAGRTSREERFLGKGKGGRGWRGGAVEASPPGKSWI